MLPVLDPDEMADVDASAPEPLEVLIERAGAAVAREAVDLMGGTYGRRAVVLVGKGSNGADGRAAAAHLRRRGVRVEVLDAAPAPSALPPADLVIDAAYGTGFRGEHEAPDAGRSLILAVDIPSGIDGRSGRELGKAWTAQRTVTFAALKPGLLLEPGRSRAGEIRLVDIGLDVSRARAGVVEGADVAAWVSGRAADGHKWQAAVLIVAGSPGMTGAAHLAAAAAQRAGAGMVRVGTPGLDDDPRRPTEAVGLALSLSGWAETVRAAAQRYGSMVLGPGLGRSEAVTEGVHALVDAVACPLVIDGDALSALGTSAAAVLSTRPAPTVLTPHDGELERLLGARPAHDRLQVARDLAASTGAVALLKGPTTVIAEPGGRVAIVPGDRRLATAGTGDVLSGVIGALLARGVSPYAAAAAGAWLHARGATLSPTDGLVAGDLPALVAAALDEVAR